MSDARGDVDGFDSGTSAECIFIEVFQSGGLVSRTRRLAALVNETADQLDSAYLATATILTAAAALEAILSEYVYLSDRPSYVKAFRKAGAPEKYEKLTGRKLRDDYPEVQEWWDRRVAIVHSEPENERSRHYGTRISAAGSAWASQTIEGFARGLWGASMPSWFRSDSGLDA